jgi:rhomboid protease GluP
MNMTPTYTTPPPPAGPIPGEPAIPRPVWQPRVTQVILGLTVVVYLLQLLTQYLTGIDYPAALGVKANDLIVQGQIWRLFTPMLLHGSILHIGFNMYALYVIGSGLERYYGRSRYLTLYILAGFTGNVLSFLISPQPSLGASTSIFGLLGAEGVLLYQNRQIFGPAARRSLTNVIMVAALNLAISLSPGIDLWGHVGGLIGGSFFAWFAGPHFRYEMGLYQPTLVDERGSGDALRAALSVGAIFAVLAGLKIFLGF